MKKYRKAVIIVIAAIASLIAAQVLYQIIGMSLVYSAVQESELRVKIENWIDEYNTSCEADRQVTVDYYYEGGPHVHCDLRFSKEIPHDDNSIISFFLTFHNDFGYDSLCNAEINSEFFRRYDEVYFNFEDIRLSYGDEMALPNPLDSDIDRKDIDVAIYGINRSIDINQETVCKFRGTLYV